VSAQPAQVWWLLGPPCAGKSVTAWQLHDRLLAGRPRALFDVDQVGMCYPAPAGDPDRYALKSRAASPRSGSPCSCG
jgi:adenylylsulfate kinase-like enzyme